MNASPNQTDYKSLFWSAVVSCVVSAVVSGLLVFAFQEWLRSKYAQAFEEYKAKVALEQHTSQMRWEIKRNACLNAMNIVEAHWSNRDWSGSDSQGRVLADGAVERQPEPSIDAVRQCYNELVLCCTNERVPKLYKHCLLEAVSGDDVVDLRNAVRAELGFGTGIDFDRARAFIGRIGKPSDKGTPNSVSGVGGDPDLPQP